MPRLLLAIVLAAGATAASATPTELIVNGGFETGAFAGWSASSSNVDLGGWDTGWNVATSAAAGGAYNVAAPIGTYAAYEAFDGSGPKTRTLAQSFVVPAGITQASLSFWDSWYSTIFHGGTLPRLFDAYLIDAADSDNVYHLAASDASPLPLALQSFDVTDFIAGRVGHMLELSFITTIPEYGTGPGGFVLDDVSLVAEIPEPTSLALAFTALLLAASLRRVAR